VVHALAGDDVTAWIGDANGKPERARGRLGPHAFEKLEHLHEREVPLLD